MLKLLAVESKHALDDFEKSQMPMNFGSYVYIVWVLAQTSQNNSVEISWKV